MKKIKKIIIPITIIAIIVIAIIAIVVNINKNTKYKLEKIEKYSYFKLYQNGKYGVIDDKGNTLIEATYDVVNIQNPTKPVFICYKDYDETTGEYKTVVLNDKKEQILTGYEEVLPIMCEESTSNIPFEKSVLKYKENGKYGIIDFKGKKITKAIYDEIESMQYREGTLLVKQNEKYGAITMKGKKIIEPKYEQIVSDSYYTEENDYTEAGFIVQTRTDDGYRYSYIDKNGKVLLENYLEIERITDIKDNENVYLLVSKNGKYGVTKNTKTLIPITYEEIEYNKQNELFIVQKNSKQGILNKEGKEIVSVAYDYVMCSENKITATRGESVEIYNARGEKQNSEYANTIEVKDTNYIITIDENDKFGISNKDGKIIVENKYEYIGYAFGNYFIATENGKVGVINTENEVIINFEYDIIEKVKDKNILQAIVSKTNTIEIYNEKAEKTETIKNAILYTFDNYVKLISDTDMIYLSTDGNKIENKEILSKRNLYAYKENEKWGYKDINGNVVVQASYDMVTEFNEYGFAGIKKDKKWGVINSKGEILVKPTYTIEWNEPEFIGKYCKLNFGYGFEYYTDELTK